MTENAITNPFTEEDLYSYCNYLINDREYHEVTPIYKITLELAYMAACEQRLNCSLAVTHALADLSNFDNGTVEGLRTLTAQITDSDKLADLTKWSHTCYQLARILSDYNNN